MNDFQEFPKMARLSREVVVSEKVDGTNAQVYIELAITMPPELILVEQDGYALVAGSRTRWITPKDDNFGFAAWAQGNAGELFKLGVGRHFGEWFGSGIQRGYGLKEKCFALFNTSRWSDPDSRPACTGIVPVLYQGNFSDLNVEFLLDGLRQNGSAISPGYMRPEGIVIYHTAANIGFKKTLEKDEVPKSVAARRELAP